MEQDNKEQKPVTEKPKQDKTTLDAIKAEKEKAVNTNQIIQK